VDKQECPQQFTPDRREILRAALSGAYADAADVCDPDRGFNDLLHGLIVYHLTAFRLQRAFEDDPEVRFESIGLGPELHVDGLRLRWNKVGRSSAEHIGTSFPRASMAATAMAEGNQQLALWSEDTGAGDPVNWILAHVGNPRDGLIRAYLAAPISTDGREVTAWARWIPIYDAAQPFVDLPDAPAPGLPVPVEIELPEVSLLDELQLGVTHG
jgi:hypothetical protein